ncbi:MAG: peptide ABC transporter substrate-binding protein, partial [Chlamydiae bacterium]|nr:peptide ABC transporter substrate-binding protein [Chlamydiota bacterium]
AKYELCSKLLIQNSVFLQGSLYVGIILPHVEDKKQQLFISAIHEAVKSWKNKVQNQQIVKLSFLELPQSLDPRLAGDDFSYTIIKMLFEGLTRLDAKGRPTLAMAQSVDISEDQKHYTFKLRKCCWSDGSKVTAKDFEYAWKTVLSPDFYTPFAYLLYPIKNARLFKERLCSMEEVGVQASDTQTLIVELEHPTPEFLELTALSLYSPVHHIVDKTHSNWSFEGSKNFVCNGPFLVKKVSGPSYYKLIKNPLYWDRDSVQIQQLQLTKDTSLIASEMFKNSEIQWLGKPMRPWESFLEESEETLQNSAPISNFWCIFNTEKHPFHNTNLRRAFDLAINKYDLVKQVSCDHLPASTPLSLSHTMHHDEQRIYGNEKKALLFFEKALEELGLSRKTFPLITFNFVNTPFREKTALYLIQQWQRLFQIPCRAEGFHFNTLFTKLLKGDFFLTGLCWKPIIDHPNYTLNIFMHKNLDVNFAKWSNLDYQRLLEQAQNELDPVKKVSFLSAAEQLLIEEVPVFSLFYEKERNKKSKFLHNVMYLKNTGCVDFKYAYMKKQNSTTQLPKGGEHVE